MKGKRHDEVRRRGTKRQKGSRQTDRQTDGKTDEERNEGARFSREVMG